MFGRQHAWTFGRLDVLGSVGADLRVRPPVGQTHWFAPTITGTLTSFFSFFRTSVLPHFRTAIAESPPAAECSQQLADSLDMNLDDAACCDVKKDGSFACYYKDPNVDVGALFIAPDYAKLESQEYCLYVTDGKDVAAFSEGCEKPNKHALWLSQTSFDVSPYKSLAADNGYTGFRVLANPSKTRLDPNVDIGTNIIGLHSIIPSPLEGEGQGEGGRVRVSGTPADSYRELTTNASELAFSTPKLPSPLVGEGEGEGKNLSSTFAMRRLSDPVFGVKEVCQQQGELNFVCDPLDFAKGDEQLENT